MKITTIKRYLSIIVITSLLLSLIAGITGPRVSADDVQDNQLTVQRIVELFGTTESFVQGYLEQGYTLNQILTAFYKADLSHIDFKEALKSLVPLESNESQSVTTEVYSEVDNKLLDINSVDIDDSSIVKKYDYFPVTEAVYGDGSNSVTDDVYGADEKNEEEAPSVTDDVYEQKSLVSLSTTVSGEEPHVSEKAPVYNKSSFNQAPYSVGSNGESISNLTGSLTLEQKDATLPGRNGMGFSLTRKYDTSSSQFYDMDFGYKTYPYPIYNYFVQYNAVRKKVTTQYAVKYTEDKWAQVDNNGDGSVDYETFILESKEITKGTYNSRTDADNAASQRAVYTTPADTKSVTDYRYSSTNSFAYSIPYSSGGYSGTLTSLGSPQVSGTYTPAVTKQAPAQTCTNSIPGKYDAKGNWYATGTGTSCPDTKTTTADGYTVTLNRTSTENTKACASPYLAGANYVCTKSWVATYTGSYTIPAKDTRSYTQTYQGYVTKPATYSNIRFDSWVTLSGGARQRYAYSVSVLPWVDTQLIEGPPENVTQVTDTYELWSEANQIKETISSAPNAALGSDNGYNYYLAPNPNASVQAYQVGTGTDVTYYNKTSQPLEEQLYPIGKGWSWNLPYIEIKDGKKRVYLETGGSYEVEGNTLKNYEWEGLSLNQDSSISLNGDVSQYVLATIDGTQKQYFTGDGRLLQTSDAYGNNVQFRYEQNAMYGRKLLTQVKDAIGNTINIEYSTSKVTVTSGTKTVVYDKHSQNGVELLDSVTDQLGRKTTYSYKIADAKFNLMTNNPERAVSNPYALITSVQYPTGAKSIYQYEDNAVKRYIGPEAINESYRLLSRKDQITYENAETEDFNRQTLSYPSDIGNSYGQNTNFKTVINNGLTNTTYMYRKNFIDDSTPAQYYLDSTVEAAEGKEQLTSYSYGKKVGNRSYMSTSPTGTVTSNNQTGDRLTTSTFYDDYGNVVQSTDQKGQVTTNTYDSAKHWLISTTSPVTSNAKLYMAYTRTPQGAISQLIVRKDSDSGALLRQVNYTYDSYGNPISQTIKNDNQSIATTNEYSNEYQNAFLTKQSMNVTDADGNVRVISNASAYDPTTGLQTSTLDGNQHKTSYQYDTLGRTIKVTYPDGKVVSALYDDFKNTVTVTDEAGIQSYTRWNALRQQIEQGYYKDSLVITGRTGYDPYSRQSWTEDALGNRTRYDYDSWNRITSTTAADGTINMTRYSDPSRQVIQTDPEGYSLTETYDVWGQLLKTEEKKQLDDSLTMLSKNSYDNISGKVIEETDGNGNTTTFNYDVLGQLVSVTDANGSINRYEYDMMGNLTKTTDPDGNSKEKKYDELAREILTSDKLGISEKKYYDESGNLLRWIDRNGDIFDYSYDLRDRLLEEKSPDDIVKFTYDNTGKRLSMKDTIGLTSYQYDPLTSNLTQVTYPDGLTLRLDYDLNGNRTHMTGPFGNDVYYSYDSMNRMNSVGSSKDKADATYSYYLNGLQDTTQTVNGVESHRRYNGLDLTGLDQIKDKAGLNSYTYEYDSNKNIVNRTQGGSEDTFKYDKLNRISTSSLDNESYSYDKQGNRLTLETEGEIVPHETENVFDSRNRLQQVNKAGEKVNYKYNGEGLLTERTENGITSRYYYDGNQIVAEATIKDGKPELKANYIRGQKLEAIQYPNGTKAYISTNGHGDITELRSEAGELLNRYKYNLWGSITYKEEKVYNPFRYSGELWDDATELQYLRARWYDPEMGRFISEDTFTGSIIDPISLNLYAYVNNNPLKYWDPTGHAPQFGSFAYGNMAHKQLQRLFLTINIFVGQQIAFTEKNVTLTSGKNGRIDFALKTGEHRYEIFELKPISQRGNGVGSAQLQRYIEGINENGFRGDLDARAIAGTSWNPNGIAILNPFDPKKEIRYYTYYSNEPGMIYYGPANRQETSIDPKEVTKPKSIIDKITNSFKKFFGAEYYPEGTPLPNGMPPLGGNKNRGGGLSPFPGVPFIPVIP
ncbi:RHS repeat-associated core domain-containing protein [Paenibacillus sp. JX-17]|uniref:RHS repeat-associated core domain-containing protein n=1 Tax=Paenibacillus lacisoli TaxID=3064525 RepID=A0ABT9CD66_9BACL|nr:RHS repeat-associated core domain-containing protein [Paenibacillus sp. JX-17]MDO7905533.1 RHS repeat-associated core domain-containing protein [Paenibacillus sp. JX-17]